MRRCGRGLGQGGFGLIEVVVSAGLLIVIAAGVSQLVAIAVRASEAARVRTMATLAGVQKMEQLRSLAWSDATTDLSADPASAVGPGLQPSPAGTIDANIPPYVDHLNRDGGWVGNAAAPGADAVFTRRWSVRPLDADPADTRVLEVFVTHARGPAPTDALRLVSVVTRGRS